MDCFLKTRPNPVLICSEDRSRDITNLIARWCWTDLRPINIVNDEGLRSVLAFLDPGYRPPSHTHIASIVQLRCDELKKKLVDFLADQDSIALTSDIWTSGATQVYSTTTAHFVTVETDEKGNQSWTLKTCCLEVALFAGHHTRVRIAKKLQDVASANHITEKVTTVVHDQAANAEIAGESKCGISSS